MGQACFRCWRCDNQPGLRAATKQAGPILAESGGESSSPAENRRGGGRGCGRHGCPGGHARAASGRQGRGSWLRETAGAPRLPSAVTPSASGLLETEGAAASAYPARHGQALRREPRAKAGAQDTNSGPVCSKLLLGPQWLCRRTNASPEATVLWGCHSCLTFCRHRLPLCDSPVCTKQGVNLVVVAGALLI